jgi:hypothetical protein
MGHSSLISTMTILQPAVTISPEEALVGTTSPKKKNKQRRVHFHEARVVDLILPFYEMSAEEKSSIWYSDNELCEFKESVRDLCRGLRSNQTSAASSNKDDSFLRGLEHRINFDRLRHKVLSNRCILMAQGYVHSDDQLGDISRKCSEWSTEMAQLQATSDFCQVYQPDMLHHVPEPSSPPDFPFSMKSKKRRSVSIDSTDSSSSQESERNVRCRREQEPVTAAASTPLPITISH